MIYVPAFSNLRNRKGEGIVKGKAAVFTGKKKTEMIEYPLVPPKKEEVLVKITMSTVCASDYHTWAGNRPGKTPGILGHEIMGTVVELGAEISTDILGEPLKEGDRITWSVFANCGQCYFCKIANLPQKCINLFKYGHEASIEPPHFNGGFAEYIYLIPGTTIIKVPDHLTDKEVTPVNCATSTAAAGLDEIGLKAGDRVLVQGGGMVGLCAASLAKDLGAYQVVVLDAIHHRLEMVKRCGADVGINVINKSEEELKEEVLSAFHGYPPDVVVEATGIPKVVVSGIDYLRIGGSYLLLGLVSPDLMVTFDAHLLIKKFLKLVGVHNYGPQHLVAALRYVERNKDRYPFQELVTHEFSLEETSEALLLSESKEAIRPAIIP